MTAKNYDQHCVKSALIFPYLDWIQRDTSHLSVFRPNVGEYGPENSKYGLISCNVKMWVMCEKQDFL